jgi:hypothetical protein
MEQQMKILFSLIVCTFYFTCFSARAEPTPMDLAVASRSGNLETIRQYLETGGNPNLRLPPQSLGAKDGRLITVGGTSTMLGIATLHNHADIVELLLARGADPNQYSQEATPLVFNLLNISAICSPMTGDTEERSAAGLSPQLQFGLHYIKDPVLREQALAPLRKIRGLLLSHGAISDWAPYFRRQDALDFQKFLAAQDDYVTFALCNSDRIIFRHQEPIQQFEIPSDMEKDIRAWFALKKKLTEWFDTQSHADDLHIAIIGPDEMEWSLLRRLEYLCEKQNISVSLFVIPRRIPCDAATLLQAFTDPAHAQLDVMDILNEYCPGPPINPFSEETEAQLRAL